MGVLYDVLTALSPAHDDEMLVGYQRYEDALAKMLTPGHINAYAEYIRSTGEIRIFEEMTPGEIASLPPEIIEVATAVLADLDLSMENRRVVALLNQRGSHEVAPDLGHHTELSHHSVYTYDADPVPQSGFREHDASEIGEENQKEQWAEDRTVAGVKDRPSAR